jgi:hemoglobin-like flavoprotein
MTDKQVLLVKHSWSYVASQLDQVSSLFVKKLLQLHPDLKSTLKSIRPDALPKLMQTVHHLVASLPDFKKAEKELLLLTAEYSNQGITKDIYDSILICFLITLEKKIGKNWSAEIREAWIFVLASTHMHLISQLQPPALLLKIKTSH